MDKKLILVTGSSKGLGLELIKEFASNNYNFVINYNSNNENLENIKKELETKYNVKGLIIKCDITNETEVKEMINTIKSNFGKIDILINNAAIAKDTLYEDKTKEDFMHILETNTYGPYLVSKEASKIMNNAQIINIASTNGLDTYYEYSADYDASKAALINLTHNMASHYAPSIRVNAVCPGWINTSMNENMDKEFKENEENKILLHRFASPKEMAKDIYQISQMNYLCDSIIRIDGGVKHE